MKESELRFERAAAERGSKLNPANNHYYLKKSLGGKLMWNFIMDEFKQFQKATDQSIKSRPRGHCMSLDTMF